jgi:NAD(P)-dependent dehydrogenase (short-subunit alcohol dehydrogenase family)
MAHSLHGKTALVTGASRGLGRAIARDLAAEGALVAINYANNEAAALETQAAIVAAGGDAFLIQGVLGSYQSALKLGADLDAELARRTGDAGLDILVNNAGGGVLATLDDTTPEIFEKTVADNLSGPFYVTKVLKPRIRQGGRVIFMSSVGARQALPQYAAYAVCKAGINTFTVITAKELGPRGVTVNCIMPGLISTDSNADLRGDPAMVDFMEKSTLLGRLGQPSDLSGVVLALVSPQMGFVTGQVIEVSGGLFF